MKKIDIHCHITSRNLRQDLIELTNKATKYNLKYIFLMSTYFPKKKNGVGNYRLYHNIKFDNIFKMYLSLDFNYFWMHFNEMTEILQDDREKIVGIKIYTGYQDIDLESIEMEKLIKLAHKYKLPIMFHTGYIKGGGRETAYNPNKLIMFMQNHHYINFIIAHLGNPFITETIKLLKNFKNIYTDISGLMEDNINFNKDDREILNEIYKNVPAYKILYGTDYPVQTYSQTNKLLKFISKCDKKKIMYSNAKELFNV